MTYDAADVTSLAAKLGALELTTGEAEALDALIARAGEAEVAGHALPGDRVHAMGMPHEHQNPFAGRLLPILALPTKPYDSETTTPQ